jgi:hypothetical protein
MALNFPADPTNGQVYENFFYSSALGVWKRTGGTGSASITVSDTVPESPTPGGLWLDSTSGNTYIYYEDEDTSQWIQTSGPGLVKGRNSEFFLQTTAPASPVDGDVWYDPSEGFTYIYYEDADSSQWIQFGLNRNGSTGIDGADGIGIPAGGSSGQILSKSSNTNYDVEWIDKASGLEAIKLSQQSITQSYSVLNNHNALSVGPITINQSVLVTIPSGSSWAIV